MIIYLGAPNDVSVTVWLAQKVECRQDFFITLVTLKMWSRSTESNHLLKSSQ